MTGRGQKEDEREEGSRCLPDGFTQDSSDKRLKARVCLCLCS